MTTQAPSPREDVCMALKEIEAVSWAMLQLPSDFRRARLPQYIDRVRNMLQVLVASAALENGEGGK